MMDEREAIVAYLRGHSDKFRAMPTPEDGFQAYALGTLTGTINSMADAIERGDHLKDASLTYEYRGGVWHLKKVSNGGDS